MKLPALQKVHYHALKLSLIVAVLVTIWHEVGHSFDSGIPKLLFNSFILLMLIASISRYISKMQHGESSLHNELLIQALKNRILFEEAPVAMLEIQHGKIVVSNRAARKLLGIQPDGIPLFDFFSKQDQPYITNWLKQSEQEHQALGRRVSLQGKGSPSTVELSMIRQSGWQSSILLVLYDVTEQAEQEALLHQSQQRLELAMHGSRDAAWDWELASGEIYYSPRGWQMLGMTPQEMPSDSAHWREYIHPDDLPRVRQLISQALQSKEERYEVSFKMLHSNGHYIPVLSRGFILRDSAGTPLRVCGTNSDRSSQASFEQSLLEDVRQMGAFIANLPGYVYRSRSLTPCTPDFISTGVRDVTGYSQDDYLLQQSILHGQEIHPDDLLAVQEIMKNSLLNYQAYEVEYRIYDCDGQLKWVWERGRGIIGKNGNPEGREGFVTEITDRKNAEQALAASEYRWKFALEGSGDGVWDWELVGNHMYLSARWQQMLDLPKQDVSEHHADWLQYLHPDDAPAVQEKLDRHIRGETGSYTSEHRLICHSGHWKWVLDRGLVVARDENGRALRMIGSTSDITERKKMSLQLEQRESLLSRMGHIAKIGGWEYSPDTQSLSWSEQTYLIHEYPADQALTLPQALSFIADDERPVVERAISHALGKGVPWDLELQVHTAKGKPRWVRMQGEVMFDRGQPVKLHGAYQDISEYKAIRLALQQEKTRLNAIFDSAVDPIIVISEQGHIEEFNPAACETFGYTRQEAFQLHVTQLIPENKHTEYWSLLNNHPNVLIHSGGRKGTELIGLRKNGEQFPAEITLSSWQEQESIYFTAVIRDITERKAVQAQLIQSQKMDSLSMLSGGLAHDFNNLLGIITGNLDFLEPRLEGDEKALLRLQSALRATERGADITRRMLALSKQRSGKRSEQAIQVNILISEIAKILQRMLGPNYTLDLDLATDAQPCIIDTAEFENALLNLTVNARDAMPDGGEIRISTQNLQAGELLAPTRRALDPGRSYLEISFADNGCGMSEEIKQRAFEPFFSTKEAKGTGLGLAMVYTFAKDLGGQVRVDSSPGAGSTFYLYLPSTDTNPETPDPPPPKRQMPQANTEEIVLVVDDEPDLLNITSGHLQQLGYRTLCAANASEALQILAQTEDISLLLSDVVMPGGMFGTELAIKVQQQYPQVAILLCSGFPQKIRDDPKYATFAEQLINKPFRKTELAVRVRETLDQHIASLQQA